VRRRTVCLLLTILCFSIFANSQTAVRATYSIPQAVSFESFSRRTFKQFYGPEEYRTVLVAGFYPIGWSRDGKFAYDIEPVDEECGCYFAELVIQDLKNDKILFHFKNDPDARVDKEGAPLPDDLRKLWKRNQRTFAAKLRQYGIVQTARFSLLPSTFTIAGKRYTAKLIRETEKGGDYDERTKKLTLGLTSSGLGTKALYTESFKSDDDYSAPLDAAVGGVFKSPLENRVAIVMIKVQRGWEGPPHVTDFQIAGGDLVSGFRNSK
jgi:hypothetical protein